jgi:4-hydroxy-L-threonine phosphate dehydrogenase PdxA
MAFSRFSPSYEVKMMGFERAVHISTKTEFIRCNQGSEHVLAIEIWARNILRKHEQISGITQIKAYSQEIATGD